MNTIFNRRSVRKFTPKAVEKDKIDKLLRAAMQAPSAGNQQPWEFIVVEDRELRKKLSETTPFAKMLREAPLGIVVLANLKDLRFPGKWEQDLGAATQNILLEAVDLGLGGVWLGVSPNEDRMKNLKDLFSLPDYVTPFGMVALGYPADVNANKFVDRFDEKKVHFEKY